MHPLPFWFSSEPDSHVFSLVFAFQRSETLCAHYVLFLFPTFSANGISFASIFRPDDLFDWWRESLSPTCLEKLSWNLLNKIQLLPKTSDHIWSIIISSLKLLKHKTIQITRIKEKQQSVVSQQNIFEHRAQTENISGHQSTKREELLRPNCQSH